MVILDQTVLLADRIAGVHQPLTTAHQQALQPGGWLVHHRDAALPVQFGGESRRCPSPQSVLAAEQASGTPTHSSEYRQDLLLKPATSRVQRHGRRVAYTPTHAAALQHGQCSAAEGVRISHGRSAARSALARDTDLKGGTRSGFDRGGTAHLRGQVANQS